MPQANPTNSSVRVFAPAKLNLTLHVGPLRDDGFHPLDSIVSKITLADRIDIAVREDGAINLTCTGHDCGPVERNLAFRAARTLADVAGGVRGADITLAKRIPPGAGLGGGSSDAATVLATLNDLWAVDLPPADLADLAAGLGSDVPVFLGPVSSRMTGRGEYVEPIEVPPFHAVLILPPIVCGTAEVYRASDELALPQSDPLDPSALTGRKPSRWRHLLTNDLAAAARYRYPDLAKLWDRTAAAVSAPLCLTGSGSAMFLLADSESEAAGLAEQLSTDIRPLCRLVRQWTPELAVDYRSKCPASLGWTVRRSRSTY